jgi:transposase, IS5 family
VGLCWAVKATKATSRQGETRMVDLAIPEFGYQNHLSAGRRHRLIRRWLVTASRPMAAPGRASCSTLANAASDVWA